MSIENNNSSQSKLPKSAPKLRWATLNIFFPLAFGMLIGAIFSQPLILISPIEMFMLLKVSFGLFLVIIALVFVPKLTKLNSFLSFLLGVFISVLIVAYANNYLPIILPIAMVVFVSILVIVIILLMFLPKVLNFCIERFTGEKKDVEIMMGNFQKKVTNLADVIADNLIPDTKPQVKQNIKNDLPDILYYFVFSRFRTTGLRFLLTVFTFIGGTMSIILLYNQNQLLSNQNEKIDNQNELIQRQMFLEEASRRSSLVVLMSNIMDKVDDEINRQRKPTDTEKTHYKLSASLIGQITALSHSFKPYRYLDDTTLIAKPLSPERGQLLLTITQLPLDTITFNLIYKSATFSQSELKDANLDNSFLQGVNLRDANLFGTHLTQANLKNADLQQANLEGAILNKANLSESISAGAIFIGANMFSTDLTKSSFSGANLSGANLSKAKIIDSNLSGANLSKAYLANSNFENANMSDVILIETDLKDVNLSNVNLRKANLTKAITNVEQLRQTQSLYETLGLNDSIKTSILKVKPELFQPHW
jgi:hypothetical protein